MKKNLGFGVSIKERNKKDLFGNKFRDYKIDNILDKKKTYSKRK